MFSLKDGVALGKLPFERSLSSLAGRVNVCLEPCESGSRGHLNSVCCGRYQVDLESDHPRTSAQQQTSQRYTAGPKQWPLGLGAW